MHTLYIYTSLGLPKELPGLVKQIPYPKDKRIVVVSPHSDDISISCGATVMDLAPFNKIVPLLFFSGHRGVEEENRERATEIREKEMAKEATILGTEKPVFLRLRSYEEEAPNEPPTEQASSMEKEDISRVEEILMRYSPEIIFLPKEDDLHPTHRLATDLTLRALETPAWQMERDMLLFPQLIFYENPWSVFGAFEFNLIALFSEKEFAKNIKAIQVHTSQLKRTPFDRAAKNFAAFRGSTVPEQRIFGYGNDTYGMSKFYIEAFKLSEQYAAYR